MATVTKPMALDESINTTEGTSRNIADVLAQELSGIATAISGGSDKAPKTDIATVEPTNVASRAYSVGELVYVNGNLYKVITAISGGATFTVGTNIQSTNVSGMLQENSRESIAVPHVSTDTFTAVLTRLKTAMDRTKLTYKSCIQFNDTIYPIQSLSAYGQFSNSITYSGNQYYCLSLDITNAKATLYGSTAGMSDMSNTTLGVTGTITLYY